MVVSIFIYILLPLYFEWDAREALWEMYVQQKPIRTSAMIAERKGPKKKKCRAGEKRVQ